MTRILVVDDSDITRDAIVQVLKSEGYTCYDVSTYKDAYLKLSRDNFDVVISDLKLPDGTGIQVLEYAKKVSQDTYVIIITGYGSIDSAIEATRKGAYDYILKPVDMDKLKITISRAIKERNIILENEYLRIKSDIEYGYVWGPSKAGQELYQTIKRAAETDSTVLIMGETGTGKEIVAREIHKLSKRSSNPFVAVNCAALSAGLLESELFGHEKGAFTGADTSRKGRFEIAHGGTILLDEISEIGQDLQSKLLRVLQFKQFERIGSNITKTVDVRVIATTNRNLPEEVQKGRFRQDLFYRLNVLPIVVPPLRQRIEDIPYIIENLLKRKFPGKKISLGDKIIKLFAGFSWPGNIRELENIMERAVIYSNNSTIDDKLIADWLYCEKKSNKIDDALGALVGLPLDEIESKLIELTVAYFNGNKEKAARALGISSRTIREKLRNIGTE